MNHPDCSSSDRCRIAQDEAGEAPISAATAELGAESRAVHNQDGRPRVELDPPYRHQPLAPGYDPFCARRKVAAEESILTPGIGTSPERRSELLDWSEFVGERVDDQ